MHFENVYHLIFQSQTDILQIINNQTENKLSKAILEAIHRRTVWIKTYAFENYIGFLVNNFLLTFNSEDQTYSITPLGILFLNYIKEMRYPKKVNDVIPA